MKKSADTSEVQTNTRRTEKYMNEKLVVIFVLNVVTNYWIMVDEI